MENTKIKSIWNNFIILSALLSLMIILQSAIAETNVTLLYGYNGTAWVPLKSDSSGVLQSTLNLTSTVSAIPRTDNLYDLGSSSFRWKAIFGMQEALGLTTAPISTLDISGNISVAGTTNSSINGSTFFVDATDSRIGINTTTPLQELNVVGQANITGRIILNGTTLIRGVSDTWPSADGSANNVLTTNGAGVLSWSAVSSLASNGWTVSGSNLYNSTANVNVGIGTSSPASLLHVTGSATNLLNVSNSTYSFLLVNTSGTFTGGATVAKSVDNQTFTANGTWTKPAGAKLVRVIVIGGGGGGGGGQGGAAGTSRQGASGGGGGALVVHDFDPSALGATETVTVGSGGSAGAGGASTTGAAGNAGGNSLFGSHVTSYGGGGGGQGVGGNNLGGGGGGTTSAGSLGTGGGPENVASTVSAIAFGGGGGGGNSANAANAVYGGGGGGGYANGGAGGSALFGAGGGGGGGAVNAANAEGTGNAGGTTNSYAVGGGGTAGGVHAAGGAGTSRSGTGKCGDGGGGGGGNAGGTGITGANGGVPGGGGAGGSGGTTTGGDGGAGGRGEVIVYTYY